MPRARVSVSARRAFSIFELFIAVIIMGVVAGTGSMKLGGQVSRIRAQAEGDRLVSCLRWMREMSRCKAPGWQSGYGVYFWNNKNTDTCLQYSPYIAANYRVPDDPTNTVSWNHHLGLPSTPVTLGQHSPMDFKELQPAELSQGLQIVFQSDYPGAATYQPRSIPNFPVRVAGGAWRRDRVVFWSPGNPAPSRPGNPWSQEYGVSLPKIGTSPVITYNRIYVLSSADNPDSPDPKELKLPVRIHIHPGTGVVRMMNSYERRDDGTW